MYDSRQKIPATLVASERSGSRSRCKLSCRRDDFVIPTTGEFFAARRRLPDYDAFLDLYFLSADNPEVGLEISREHATWDVQAVELCSDFSRELRGEEHFAKRLEEGDLGRGGDRRNGDVRLRRLVRDRVLYSLLKRCLKIPGSGIGPSISYVTKKSTKKTTPTLMIQGKKIG